VAPAGSGQPPRNWQRWSSPALDLSPEFVLSVIRHSILPALSLVLVGVGGWFMGMRALVSNIVTEDIRA
jgi:ABC-type dipeptide/oligopeptide/nickel transport system permease component